MAAKPVSRNNIGHIPFKETDEDGEEDSDKEEDDECLHKLQPLIDEINKFQEACNTQLPRFELPEKPEEISEETFIEFNRNIEALNDGNERWCADCSMAIRVVDMNSLQRGQHISIPGQHSSHYFKSLGKRISAYQHHAIVKDIVQKTSATAQVILIHFYMEDKVMKVCEQTRDFNLRYDELYIIRYQHPRYDPDTIVQRAESVLKQSENGELFKCYNPFTKNCEHFSTWCVIGEKKSLQAQTFLNDMKQMLWNVFGGSCKIARLILKLIVDSSDEIASFVTRAVQVPSVVLGVSFAIHIIYCVIRTVYLIKQYRNEKTICWHCLKEKLLDLWLQFGVFGVTSVITFVIINFALTLLSPMVAIPIAAVLVIAGTALTLAVPRIRKAFFPLVHYSQKEMKTFSEIKVGDVLSLTYFGLSHVVVVSDVHMYPNPEQGKIQGIHYSLPSLCGTRVIAEENFEIDLKRSKVHRVHLNIAYTYSPQEVVDRARKRIGEQKWNISSNRSDHLCSWAKEKSDYYNEDIFCREDENSEKAKSGQYSSLLVRKDAVHLMNEIQPGDVVEYKSYKGIIINLEDLKDGREFCMDIVVRKSFFEQCGGKIKLEINLNKSNLVVYRYQSVHCVSMSERVEKAEGMIGRTIQRWTRTGFIKDVILKQREKK